jgi:L-rhamnose mutarotase
MATAVAPERKNEMTALDPERPWTAESVWAVDFIRVKPGQELEYGRRLADTWKKVMDEQKKQGVVLSYKILTGPPSSRDEFTHLLMIEFPNYAALDQREKMDAAVKKVFGSLGSMQEMFRKREEVREAIGTRLLREMRFKEP